MLTTSCCDEELLKVPKEGEYCRAVLLQLVVYIVGSDCYMILRNIYIYISYSFLP